MNARIKTTVCIASMLVLVGFGLIVYFCSEGNYLDLAYGSILIIYAIKLYYLVYKKSKGLLL